MNYFERKQSQTLYKRLHENRQFIQIVAGPRQVGKTTLVNQVIKKLEFPYHFASADNQEVNSTINKSQRSPDKQSLNT